MAAWRQVVRGTKHPERERVKQMKINPIFVCVCVSALDFLLDAVHIGGSIFSIHFARIIVLSTRVHRDGTVCTRKGHQVSRATYMHRRPTFRLVRGGVREGEGGERAAQHSERVK